MSSLAWLPPLNSHREYITYVSFHNIERGRDFWPLKEEMFLITVSVSVEYASPENKEKKPFPGLDVKKVFYIPFRKITHPLSSYETSEFLKSVRATFHLSFEFDRIIFEDRDSGTSYLDTKDMAAIIQNTLYSSKSGACTDMLYFDLYIKKKVTVSDDEYDCWTSWYNVKRDANPNFEVEYHHAITRGRSSEEILNERQDFFSRTKAKLTVDVLKDVRIDSSGLLEDCLICLCELPSQKEASRLRCSHVFHESCMIKWIQESNDCPVCRSRLR